MTTQQKPTPLKEALDDVREAKGTPLTELPEVIVTAELTEATQDVLLSFGLDAAGILNEYCCHVEDALIEQVRRNNELKEKLHDFAHCINDLAAFKQTVLEELGLELVDGRIIKAEADAPADETD